MNPSKLTAILSNPGTNEPLNLNVSSWAEDEPYSGWLENKEGIVVGRLDNFRFDFIHYQPVNAAERLALKKHGAQEATVKKSEKISCFDDRIEWSGQIEEIGDYLRGLDGNTFDSFFEFKSNAHAIEICFHSHGWSGVCDIVVNGIPHATIDLFNLENAIVKRFMIDNPSEDELLIRVSPSEKRNSAAMGKQLLLEYILEYSNMSITPQYQKHPPRNRGGEFRQRFFEMSEDVAKDGLILDIGGGHRQLDDSRYINLEYSLFDEPDIIADGTALPFMDETFDFVYTAAVLEHVRNPLKMGEEIYRILKKGGRVLANAAFMQPVHSEGQHFFNLTPYGIDHVFWKFAEKRIYWENGLAFTAKWIANLSHAASQVGADKIEQFIELAAEIEKHTSHQRGMYFASGVWLEGKKQ